MCPNVRTVFAKTKRYMPVLYFRTERTPAGGGWEVEAGSTRVLDRAPQGTPCTSPRGIRGSQEHKARKARKMAPSAARVAGIASAACTRVSTRPSILWRQSETMGRVQEYVTPYER